MDRILPRLPNSSKQVQIMLMYLLAFLEKVIDFDFKISTTDTAEATEKSSGKDSDYSPIKKYRLK